MLNKIISKNSPLRDAILAFITVLLVASVSSATIYYKSSDIIRKELEESLYKLGTTAGKFLDMESHKKSLQQLNSQNEAYKTIHSTLMNFLSSNSHIASLQTLGMRNGKVYVVGDVAKKDSGWKVAPLSPLGHQDELLEGLFRTKHGKAFSQSVTDNNGASTVRSYVPVQNPDGTTALVIATTLDHKELNSHIDSITQTFFTSGKITVLFALIFALLVFDSKRKEYKINCHKKSARDVSVIYKQTVQEIIQTFSASSQVIHQASNLINTKTHMMQEDTNNSSAMIEQFSQNIANLNHANQQLSDQLARLLDNAITCHDIAKDTSDRVGKAAQSFDTIGQSSEKTNAAIKLILDVSSRIDLLAVNAAIEAARAGDFGRGFGVVAAEVKSLSQEAKKAAETISFMLKQSEETVKDSMEAVHSIRGSVHETNYMSEELSNLAKSQQRLQQSINESLRLLTEQSNRLKQSLISVSSHAEDATYKTTEMSTMAEQLKRNTNKLELESEAFLMFLNNDPRARVNTLKKTEDGIMPYSAPTESTNYHDHHEATQSSANSSPLEMILEAVPIQKTAA